MHGLFAFLMSEMHLGNEMVGRYGRYTGFLFVHAGLTLANQRIHSPVTPHPSYPSCPLQNCQYTSPTVSLSFFLIQRTSTPLYPAASTATLIFFRTDEMIANTPEV